MTALLGLILAAIGYYLLSHSEKDHSAEVLKLTYGNLAFLGTLLFVTSASLLLAPAAIQSQVKPALITVFGLYFLLTEALLLTKVFTRQPLK